MKAQLGTQALAGLLFGGGLAVSGMTDPQRVIDFLDVTGRWDPSLLFVMGGALATFGGGMFFFHRLKGGRGWFGCDVPSRNTDPIDARLILGSAIFGIGWGLGGFCPGPALANLAALRTEALVFVPLMAIGMLAARMGFGADKS